MNVFRLVLFLAGLAAYLVAKQWLQPSVSPASPAESSPSVAPAAEAREAVLHSAQAAPPTDILQPEQGIVEARKK